MFAIPRMMPRGGIGIEIGPRHLRAVRFGGRRSRPVEAMEVEWSVEVPDEAVTALKERFGTGNRVAVSVDVSALLVKRLALPPLTPEQRREMVTLDPERYFPVRAASLVVGVREDDLVVAAHSQQFDRLTEALSAVGCVESVEPAPMALVRHLAASGISDGTLVVADPHDRDAAVATFEAGRVVTLRKVRAVAAEIVEAILGIGAESGRRLLFPWQEPLAAALAERLGATLEAVPSPPGTTESFAAANGARLGIADPPELALVSRAMERRTAMRGWQRGALATGALLASLVLGFWSLDYRRERTLTAIEERVVERQDEAAQVQTLLADITAAEEEVATLAAVSSERHDPLAVLLLVTQLLPPDAYLRGLHAAGDEWEIDGYARDAARLIPTFEESEALTEVRFRTATTRVQLNNETYESFSLALRYVPPAH